MSSAPERSEPTANTKRRLAFAVIVLIVVAVLLAILNKAIQSNVVEHPAFDGGAVNNIVIKTDGNVNLVRVADGSPTVERKSTYVAVRPTVSEKVDGSTLELTARCKGLQLGKCSNSYTLGIPARVSVHVESGSGDVKVDQVESAVDVVATSGDVTFSKTYGEMRARTNSGKVTGDDISSLAVTAKTTGGAIDLPFTVSPQHVDISSVSGKIAMKVPQRSSPFKVDASSRSGRSTVDVRNDPQSPRSIVAHSDTGDVSVQRSS